MIRGHKQRNLAVLPAIAAIVVAGGLVTAWHGVGYVRGTRFVQARMVSIQPLPAEEAGEHCDWQPASASESFVEVLRQHEQELAEAETEASAADLTASQESVHNRAPVRMIKDQYPDFSSVAVDEAHDEVVMTDESKFSIMTFSRTTNTPPTARMSEPRRTIGGVSTWVEFQSGVWVDPDNGDLYATNDDTVDKLVVFGRDQKGDEAPKRIINTPHTTYSIAGDAEHHELFLTVQEAAAVSIFSQYANQDDPPIRLIQGDHTQMGDPHGIAVDPQKNLLFVANFGSVAQHRKPPAGAPLGFGASKKPNWPIGREGSVAGSGEFTGAAILVFPRDASGDVTPIQVIKGSKTLLDWPTGLTVDEKRGEIYVANDAGNNILVFDENANGNVAPKRVIEGPKSLVKSPTGVFYDAQHDELWCANFGNHSATVYKALANGDATPVRVIRTAPIDTPTPNLGNAYAPAYDKNRDQILIPN